MKPPIVSLFAAFAWIVLAGAATPTAAVVATKDQVLKAYAGNTLYEDAPTYEWAAFYDPDGEARGKGWNLLGSQTSEGHWRVTENGLFCIKWDRKNWAGGAENCYKIELAGSQTELTHVSGPDGGDRKLVIKDGNPYKL